MNIFKPKKKISNKNLTLTLDVEAQNDTEESLVFLKETPANIQVECISEMINNGIDSCLNIRALWSLHHGQLKKRYKPL